MGEGGVCNVIPRVYKIRHEGMLSSHEMFFPYAAFVNLFLVMFSSSGKPIVRISSYVTFISRDHSNFKTRYKPVNHLVSL